MHAPEQELEHVEQRIVRPVQVFDKNHCGLFAHQLLEELGPGVVQAVAGDERVEVAGDVEPKRQP